MMVRLVSVVDGTSRLSPEYDARMISVPTGRDEVETEADVVPDADTARVAVPSGAPLAVKATVPVGLPGEVMDTDAVRTTFDPTVILPGGE